MTDSRNADFDLYKHIPRPPPLLDPSLLESPLQSPPYRLTRSRQRTKGQGSIQAKGPMRHKSSIRDVEKDTSPKDRSTMSLAPGENSGNETSLLIENTLKGESKCEAHACLCHRCEDFMLTQTALPADPTPIPLIYRDNTDHLFDADQCYARFPCVYLRKRKEEFAGYVEQLLDPNLLVYHGGELVPSTPCLVHKPALVSRLTGRCVALQHSEFTFDSMFEGGNLDRAVLVKSGEFHLFLTPDTNTQGYTQWFYFAIRNVRKAATVRISVVNFTKNGSPFGRDMKPSVFSVTRQRYCGTSWTRGGYDVRYSKNTLPRSATGINTYYTLSFSYTFAYEHDTVYFAHSEPYTYTRLTRFLSELKRSLPSPSEVCVDDSLVSSSLGGLSVFCLSISDHSSVPKKKVAVTARVHPGETVSSFIMEGFLRFITSQHPAAVYLRRCCSIIVIPMLNPDGVVAGNTRTGLAGVDLNRKWDNPDMTLHPEVSSVKALLTNSVCFVDLHGHSKKDYCFMYGNSFARKDERFWTNRFLPIVMAKLTQHFNYSFCYFFNSHTHDKAARTVMFSEKGVLHSFTLEASFNGSGAGESKNEFGPEVLREIGGKLGEAIYGLVAYLMKKSGKEISTQDGVYSLANQLLTRLKHFKSKSSRAPLSTTTTTTIAQTHDTSVEASPHRASPNHAALVDTPDDPSSEVRVSEGSDSEPDRDDLPQTEKQSVSLKIQTAVETYLRKPRDISRRRIGKSSSKLMFQDPVERVMLKFLGPSQTHGRLVRLKPFTSGKRFLEDDSPAEPRASQVPVRKYAALVSTMRRHGPDQLHTPKGSSFESYLQLVREVRYRMVSRFPAI